MKVDMSPKAIENRLKLVGELTKACLRIRRESLKTGLNEKYRSSTKAQLQFDYENNVVLALQNGSSDAQ